MRTLAITQNITLDGRIEMLGDWFDPTADAPDIDAEVHRQSEHEEFLLLGRRTFEDFRGFWPHQSDDPTGNAQLLDAVQKLVVSSTMTDPAWQNSTVLGTDWLDRVRALKAAGGGDVVITGSVSLCAPVLEAGLVDELRLFTYPVVQGRGRRLFPDGWDASLELRRTVAFEGGVVLTTYALT